MTGDAPAATAQPFDWKQFGGLIAVALSLFGLVWNAALITARVDDQGKRLERVEAVQRADHDTITGLRAGVDYLVERERRRDRGDGR